MTVQELISELQKHDPSAPVYYRLCHRDDWVSWETPAVVAISHGDDFYTVFKAPIGGVEIADAQ